MEREISAIELRLGGVAFLLPDAEGVGNNLGDLSGGHDPLQHGSAHTFNPGMLEQLLSLWSFEWVFDEALNEEVLQLLP